jgi:NAD(P)-dependent dehydrogenase (short-subunit alcohol dehydrogenase family)
LVIDNSKVESIEEGWLNALSIVKDHQLGVIDILVNNAGVNGGHLPNATESDYDIVMDTNLKGVFFFSQIAGKYMVERKVKGNILNVASSSSLRPAVSAYTISKWGIRGLTMGLARSLSKYGITVNGIAPGQTLTPMMTNDIDSNSNIAKTDIPLGRWILPEEIANGALFLVSDLGRAVVGDILYMTGGAALLSYEDVSYDIF